MDTRVHKVTRAPGNSPPRAASGEEKDCAESPGNLSSCRTEEAGAGAGAGGAGAEGTAGAAAGMIWDRPPPWCPSGFPARL